MPSGAGEGEACLRVMQEAAEAGGREALHWYRRGEKTSAAIFSKAGGSPVTAADLAADAAIRARLEAAFPAIAIHSEEAPSAAEAAGAPCFIVDPIDGTRAFIAGRDEWCVSIGLMAGGRPAAGVIVAPARQEVLAGAPGRGLTRNGSAVPAAAAPGAVLRIAGPESVVEALGPGVRFERLPPVRALAYRLAMVATGNADVALATPGCHVWDIAAAAALIEAAGAQLVAAPGPAGPDLASRSPMPALIAGTRGALERVLPRWMALVSRH